MKNLFLGFWKLMFLSSFVLLFSLSIKADNIAPVAAADYSLSESYLSTSKRSIGASTDINTISSPRMGVTAARFGEWDDPFLPGGDDWDTGSGGNVGGENTPFPIGDISYPILLSMLLIYFIYRGVSSKKRKSI